MNCKKCGNIINKDTPFCNICGEKNIVEKISNTTNERSPLNNNIDKKTNKNKIFIPIIIVVGLALMFIIGLFIGKSMSSKNNNDSLIENNNNQFGENNNDSSVENDELTSYTHNLFVPSKVEKEINNTELGKNVTIDEIFFNPNHNSYSKYKDAYFYGKNNNSIPVSVNLILEYYDSEGYRIEKDSSLNTIIQPRKEFVLRVTIKDDSLNYSKVKLSYEVNKLKSYEKSFTDKELDITSSLSSDGNINILIKNNSSEKISGNLACLYYKDNKIVFAQDSYISSLEQNQSNVSTCHIYKLNLNEDYSNLKRIEYDDYKVILYSAYNIDSSNY